MARIFGRSDETDIATRDDIEVVRDQDPVVVDSDDDTRQVVDDPVVLDRALSDAELRRRVLDDPELRARLMADPAVQERVYTDDDVRRRIVQDELERRGVVTPEYVGNAPAIVGVVLGLVAIGMGVIPVLFPGAIGLGFIGLVSSLIGRRRAKSTVRRVGGGTAVVGAILSLIGIALGVIGLLITADVINNFDSTIRTVTHRLHNADRKLYNWLH